EQLLGLGWLGRLLQHASRAAPEIPYVERSLVDRFRDALREVERVVVGDARGRRVLPHVVEDRALGAAGEDRLRNAVDPDARAPAAASLVAGDRLERVDAVGTGPLAETEEDHPGRAVRHVPIIARPTRLLEGWATQSACPRANTAARTCRGSGA